MTKYKFWMVWREESPITKFRHYTKTDALNEAERLASANPGEVFYVLKSTAAVVADKPNTRQLKLTRDQIPF